MVAVDFTTGDQPWPIFKLQKEFNAPGKSPPLSASVFIIVDIISWQLDRFICSIIFVRILISGSSTLVGLHTGERRLQKLMQILQQQSWQRFYRGMALWFSMYAKRKCFHRPITIVCQGLWYKLLKNFRWHMEAQILGFIMERILVQMSQIISLILRRMIMWVTLLYSFLVIPQSMCLTDSVFPPRMHQFEKLVMWTMQSSKVLLCL